MITCVGAGCTEPTEFWKTNRLVPCCSGNKKGQHMAAPSDGRLMPQNRLVAEKYSRCGDWCVSKWCFAMPKTHDPPCSCMLSCRENADQSRPRLLARNWDTIANVAFKDKCGTNSKRHVPTLQLHVELSRKRRSVAPPPVGKKLRHHRKRCV